MIIDNSGTGIARLGRNEDRFLAHVAEGERVVPPVISAETQARLSQEMMQAGLNPNEYIVGSGMSINPITGQPEFGWLKKSLKSLKKVTKKAAPLIGALAIPGIGGALSSGLSAAGTALGIPSGIGSSFLGGKGILDRATAIRGGIGNLFAGRGEDYDPEYGTGQSAVGRIEDTLKSIIGDDGKTRREELEDAGISKDEIDKLFANPVALNTKLQEIRSQKQSIVDEDGNPINTSGSGQDGMGMGGKFALAGLAGLLGKLAYEEQKKQKGVPLTPLTTMDALGRYNIESEIARRTGEAMPSRVEFGLTAEGLPALSGGMPRMARDGGIMAFAQGGAVAMQEGGEPPINMADFPRKNGEIDGPGTGTSDSIPAMLSDGEFVMTAKAVENAGSYDMSAENGIVTLSPNGGSDRESGTRIMYKLMNHFENLA